MSYESDECKLLIDEAIHDYLHDDTETEMTVKDWFYDLRKQATKADEYEAKAKAFDEIFKLYIGYEDGWISFPRGSKSFNKEIINVCKSYESGGYDAKK